MFTIVEEGKKIAFQDTETKEFKIGRVKKIINKKKSEVETESGETIIIRNKKMRVIKT